VDPTRAESACNFEPNNLRTYIVQQSDLLDINNSDTPRPDEDIINHIAISILKKEGVTLDEQKRAEFRQSLMDCNSSLDTSKLHDPNEQLSITPGANIIYSLIQ